MRLTGPMPLHPWKMETVARDVPIVLAPGASLALAEQAGKMTAFWSALKKTMPGLIGAGIDGRDGSVLIDVRSPA